MGRTVTEEELVKRINRRLTQDEEMLVRTTDGSSGYCLLDIHRNILIEEDVDIEALARGLEVMHEDEALLPAPMSGGERNPVRR